MPVTTPELFTVATPVLDDAQVYVNGDTPVAAGVNVVVLPTQALLVPVMVPAVGFDIVIVKGAETTPTQPLPSVTM